jgi:hypothetical protein
MIHGTRLIPFRRCQLIRVAGISSFLIKLLSEQACRTQLHVVLWKSDCRRVCRRLRPPRQSKAKIPGEHVLRLLVRA